MGQQGGNVNLWHWKADWQADITARKEMEDQYPNMYVDDYPFAQPVEGNLARAADYTDQNYLPALKAGNLFAATSLSSPVEDINAGGFGTLTAQPSDEQNVQGLGVWKDGTWLVIFSRDLASAEKDDVSFASGKSYSVAFAIWDGSNGERNGQKSTSQWITLQLRDAPQAPKAEEPNAPDATVRARNITLMVVGFFGILILIGALIYVKLPDKT
jgi:cytochrome b558/566 subunit A